jgi:hypothetical protein
MLNRPAAAATALICCRRRENQIGLPEDKLETVAEKAVYVFYTALTIKRQCPLNK